MEAPNNRNVKFRFWRRNGDIIANGAAWFEVFRPQGKKTLACWKRRVGAMMEWENIVKVLEVRLGLN